MVTIIFCDGGENGVKPLLLTIIFCDGMLPIMARPLRIEYPGAWYHVTCRGNERRDIFRDDNDRIKFIEVLSASTERYLIEIHAYVLMNNHFHLVLKTHDANLRHFMQQFNTTYTVYFNNKYRRSGHLFQGRYKAILIDADNYLLELSRYVHLNPVRIKKLSQYSIKEKKDILAGYPWSSLAGYISRKGRQDFVVYDMIMGMLGGRDDRIGRAQYEIFVQDGIVKDMNVTFWNGVKGQAVLGAKEFIEDTYKRFINKNKINDRELPGIKDLHPCSDTVEEIAREVAAAFGIDVDKDELRRKRCAEREARSVLMELCCIYLARKMSLFEIGKKLGGVSVAALSQNRKRLAERMNQNKSLRNQFQKLASKLNDGNQEVS